VESSRRDKDMYIKHRLRFADDRTVQTSRVGQDGVDAGAMSGAER